MNTRLSKNLQGSHQDYTPPFLLCLIFRLFSKQQWHCAWTQWCMRAHFSAIAAQWIFHHQCTHWPFWVAGFWFLNQSVYILPLVKDFSFVLKKGEHLMTTGFNGVGKSSMARVLAGLWASSPSPSFSFFLYVWGAINCISTRHQTIITVVR